MATILQPSEYRERRTRSHCQQPDWRRALQQFMNATLDATELGLPGSAVPDEPQPDHVKAHIVIDLRYVQLDRQNNHVLGTVDVSLFAEGAIRGKLDVATKQS
jgi:hypothetical protein